MSQSPIDNPPPALNYMAPSRKLELSWRRAMFLLLPVWSMALYFIHSIPVYWPSYGPFIIAAFGFPFVVAVVCAFRQNWWCSLYALFVSVAIFVGFWIRGVNRST